MSIRYLNTTVKDSPYHVLLEEGAEAGKSAGIIVDATDGYVVGTASFEAPGTHQQQIERRNQGKLLGIIGGDMLVAHWSDVGKRASDYLASDPVISEQLKGALGLLDSMRTQKAINEPRTSRKLG